MIDLLALKEIEYLFHVYISYLNKGGGGRVSDAFKNSLNLLSV